MLRLSELTSRRSKITILLTAILILFAGIATAIVISKNRPTAEEVGIVPSAILVHIIESGASANGIVRFGGDCDNDYFPTQDGSVSCSLKAEAKKSVGANYEISGISYQSFTSRKVVTFPLQLLTGNSEPIFITQGTLVNLVASIDLEGKIIMQILCNGELVDLPPGIGLYCPD